MSWLSTNGINKMLRTSNPLLQWSYERLNGNCFYWIKTLIFQNWLKNTPNIIFNHKPWPMKKFLIIPVLVILINFSAYSQSFQPVNPNASPEAKALLSYLYSLKGKSTLSAQHNYPSPKEYIRSTDSIVAITGKVPAIQCEYKNTNIRDRRVFARGNSDQCRYRKNGWY